MENTGKHKERKEIRKRKYWEMIRKRGKIKNGK